MPTLFEQEKRQLLLCQSLRKFQSQRFLSAECYFQLAELGVISMTVFAVMK